MKFGLMIERKVTSSELAQPSENGEVLSVLYSLLHPYDEINPVLMAATGMWCAFNAYLVLSCCNQY